MEGDLELPRVAKSPKAARSVPSSPSLKSSTRSLTENPSAAPSLKTSARSLMVDNPLAAQLSKSPSLSSRKLAGAALGLAPGAAAAALAPATAAAAAPLPPGWALVVSKGGTAYYRHVDGRVSKKTPTE
jgi:hypothetical protein